MPKSKPAMLTPAYLTLPLDGVDVAVDPVLVVDVLVPAFVVLVVAGIRASSVSSDSS
jgi:hypothetical protein